MTRTGTGTRRGATRQRLYEAAVALIAEQGFSSTTVDQIAERAGVAKGTVYYNFGSKTELFEELLRHGVRPLTTSLEHAARAAFARGGGAADALDEVARAGLVFIAAHPDLARLLVAELWRPNRAWHATLVELRGQVAEVVEEVLVRGMKTGEFDGGLDVGLISGALIGTVVAGALDWQTFHPGRPLDEVHASLSLLLRGRLAGGDRP
ncbi:TetR/AcrR family transcriptional regulator [Streptomyces sp. MP131-18]|uniref:TetR/AcrR family transcriptional regulator n=1 Tax=Streptomyces sp. MP131-18 TaxID=1857892 RepID=UPI00097C4228|nr:TetR/AcrR family transcriptional regulator [Streptomyces sp. MP131-18]ONK15012.1 Fatty acid metabolism regulator protein [Streptomyces sp. MP131-18]